MPKARTECCDQDQLQEVVLSVQHVLQVVEQGGEGGQEEQCQADSTKFELFHKEELEDVDKTGHYGQHRQERLGDHGEYSLSVDGPLHSRALYR